MPSSIQDKLTADERKEALIMLLTKQQEIMSCLISVENEFNQKGYDCNVIQNLKKEIEKRFEYLRKVTGSHTVKTLLDTIETGEYKKRLTSTFSRKCHLFKAAFLAFVESLFIFRTTLGIAILKFKINMAKDYLAGYINALSSTQAKTDQSIQNAIQMLSHELDLNKNHN